MLITPIDINMKFHSLELIEEYMKTIAKNNGFKLHVTRHKDASGIFYRGKFDCSYKDPNFKGNKKLKRTCSFSATFCKSGMTYEFTKCNYEHNHILKKPATIESGMIMKTKADELTGEEKTIVRDYCTKLDMYHLKLLLKTNFKGVDYSNDLLHNVVQREKSRKKKDENPLQALLDYGEDIRINGGIFEVGVDGDGRIDRIILQTELQKSLATLYGDFFIVDGTHCTNVHGMTLILPCVIDCFGKTKVVGVILCHNESHDDILVGLKALELGKKGSIMMSDGGLAFASVADELGIQQCLCSYHFSLDLFSTTTQMDIALRESYLKQYNALLHESMDIETFEEQYKNLHGMLVQHPKAQHFVENLYRSRHKVAFAFVKNFFTAACRSSQRGESINSLLKHNGSKIRKNYLKTLNIHELLQAIDEIINHQYAEDIEYIKGCITKGTKMTKFVEQYMEAEKKNMDKYRVHKINPEEFVVTGLSGSIARIVTLKEDNLQCTCSSLKNMKLPCRHIAAAAFHYNSSATVARQFMDIKHLSSRWQLTHHPLYRMFQKTPSDEETSGEALCGQKGNICIMENLHKIKYPSKNSVRHSKLSEICYPLVDEGTKSEYSYKVVMTYLSKCVNGILEFLQSDGTGDCMDYIMSASTTRLAYSKNDKNTSTTNHGNRRMYLPKQLAKKRKRYTECSACRFYLDSCVTDHREYTTKCPQRGHPNHKKNEQEALKAKESTKILSQQTLHH
jgi:SWIM zinc finger